MRRITVFFLLNFLVAVPVFAATYTVKTSGGDYSAPGTCANAVSAGDVCEVYSGTFSGWTASNSGSAVGGYITVRAATGQSPVLSSGIAIGNTSYLRIEDLYINGSISNSSGATAHHIQVVDCTLDGTGADLISLNASDVLISGVTFTDLQSEDAIRQFGQRWTIRNCTLINESDTEDQHLDFWQSGCWGGDGASYTLFENNEFRNITGTDVHLYLVNATESCDHPATNHIVRYNNSWNVGAEDGTYTGVWVDDNQQHADSGNNSVYNNVWGSQIMTSTYNILHVLNGSENTDYLNNLHSNATGSYTSMRGAVMDTVYRFAHNLYYDDRGTVSLGTYSQPNSILNSDPLLTDPDNGNYTIASNSPAVDMGGPLTYTNGSGSSTTTLIVDDAKFFSPGWGGAEADTIYVRTVARPDVLVDFESGNNGDSVTTAYLATVTRGGSGSWSYREGGANGTVSTTYLRQTPNPTYVDGAWYDDASGTRGWAFPNDSGDSDVYSYDFGSNKSKATIAAYIRAPQFTPSGGYHDLLFLSSSLNGGCVAQFVYGDCSDNCESNKTYIQAHTAATDFGGTQRSDQETPYDIIEYDSYINEWMLVQVEFDGSAGSCTVKAFDPTTLALIGESDINDTDNSSTLTGKTIRHARIGNDPHSRTADPHYYDNVMVSYTGGNLLPTGALRTAKISSINYETNTITLASAITWQDGDEVGLYAMSDGTVVYAGNAPDIGTYETGIAPPSISAPSGFRAGGGFTWQ